MKGVSVKEARLLQQWLNTTIASATWKDLINFFNKDLAVLSKASEELEKSELYNTIGKEIQDRAEALVEEKCKPEWNRISDEMKPLGEKANALQKEKAGGNWDDEKEKELDELNKKMAELSSEYQKVTDEANKELNEFKDKRISEEQGSAFLLEDDEYATVGGYAGF